MIKTISIDDQIHCLDTLSILLKEHNLEVKVIVRCKSATQALDCLLKPIDLKELIAAVHKVNAQKTAPSTDELRLLR